MKVAFGKIKITPKKFVDKPLAGYTRKDYCLGKLDDIYAHGILIENTISSNKLDKLLLISVDTLKLPISIIEYIKKKLLLRFDSLTSDHILIHATHTHASFDLTGEYYWPGGLLAVMRGIMFGANRNDRYIIWIAYRIVKMVERLFEKLELCKIAWKKKKFNPDIIINRRYPERKVLTNLGVISFKSLKNNELIGLIINFACHPTTLSFKNNMLSADYPGRIIFRIDELTNNKISAIYFNGPSGDLNPITTCGTNYEKIATDKTLVYNQLGTYKHTEKIGSIIAEEALKLAKSIPENEYFNDIEFEIYIENFLIPMKDHKYLSKMLLKNKLIWVLKKYFLMNIAKVPMKRANFPIFLLVHKGFKIYCRSLVQFYRIKAKSGKVLKNLGLITVPGELFEDIGINLIKKSPIGDNNTFIFQSSQDWIAYLFPLKVYVEEGGYEPRPSFSPLCGIYIEKEILSIFKKIKDKK